MAKEQTFKSPGFFDREIDATRKNPLGPVGTPYGVIGTAERGPAFVPITVGDMDDYREIFGGLDSKRFAPYAVDRIFKAKSTGRGAVTFLRVLGAGANATITDFNLTETAGIVKSAGFQVAGSKNNMPFQIGPHAGAVQFIVGRHSASLGVQNLDGQFADNDSHPANRNVTADGDLVGSIGGINLVRGVVFLATGTRLMCTSSNVLVTSTILDGSNPLIAAATDASGEFKLILSASADSTDGGPTFGGASGAKWTTDKVDQIRIFTASLDPGSNNYFGKVLNTNPERFAQEQHYLYLDFQVASEIASSSLGASFPSEVVAANVAVVSGSASTSGVSALGSTTFLELFGRYDTRYRPARTTYFMSQPFGRLEYDLFYLESLDDGEWANERIKVSITNLRASIDPLDPYGTFTVMIRSFNDTDGAEQVLEQFGNVNLNPESDRYIAKVIGDNKTIYNFDEALVAERGYKKSGRYPNASRFVRVVESDTLKLNKVPKAALPTAWCVERPPRRSKHNLRS